MPTPADPLNTYREAADALVRNLPPPSEEARRKLLNVTTRAARRRKAG